MSLESWRKNGWLVEHQTSQQEIADLLAVARRDLADCQAKGLSVDWRFNIAYNAALQLATIALAAAGYRASREAHHYRVIFSLEFTIGTDGTLVAKFDAFRKKRNAAGYERVGLISDKESEEMIDLAKQLQRDVPAWLKKNYSRLLE
jgi:3-deoxy-D-arabino-heptulosonate 7-phosphate (DAHP) synthase